jgi:hypothetical protein
VADRRSSATLDLLGVTDSSPGCIALEVQASDAGRNSAATAGVGVVSGAQQGYSRETCAGASEPHS